MMNKRLFTLLLVVILAFLTIIPVTASNEKQLLLDHADLLSAKEEEKLTQKLEALGKEYKVDVAIVTLTRPENEDDIEIPEGYVEELYDKLELGGKNGGLLLLFSVESRDLLLHYDTIIDGNVADSIREAVTPYLSDKDYSAGFEKFVSECDHYINYELNGYPFPWGSRIAIALVIGLIVSLIVTGIMKGQLKSVHFQKVANNYIVRDSLRINQARDAFLYSTVTRTKRPQNDSSSGSSGGSSRGTSRGKV